MVSRLWYMNADFEMELAAAVSGRPYRRPASFEKINRRLTRHLLWLASPGDALLIDEPWPESLSSEAKGRGVELISPTQPAGDLKHRIFTPWGWTASAVA
ncbi:MAG: hypothetical protein ACRD68_17540, partial [Pyrinomonadaceae bacterium]